MRQSDWTIDERGRTVWSAVAQRADHGRELCLVRRTPSGQSVQPSNPTHTQSVRITIEVGQVPDFWRLEFDGRLRAGEKRRLLAPQNHSGTAQLICDCR